MLIMLPVLIAFAQIQFDYVPSVRRVTHRVAGIVCTGFIDTSGSFTPDYKDLERGLSAKLNTRIETPVVSRPMSLLSQIRHNQLVYEYRDGLLVPMIYDELRGVVPEENGKIIKFSDYRYNLFSRVIYNLPGRFVLKKD